MDQSIYMDMLQPMDKFRTKQYLLFGVIIGSVYSLVEYPIREAIGDPQAFLPLIIRSVVTAVLIALTLATFEAFFKEKFLQRTFLYLVIARTFAYTLVITLWLTIVNGFWHVISGQHSFSGGIIYYLRNETYVINLVSVFLIMIVVLTITQINGLHRKGELMSFILGRYHQPKEVSRAFAFIDLKDSTSIAEKLGHYKFGLFLKDYYSDLTEAIWISQAEIYQYVGDEIILSWPEKKGFENQNIIRCIQQMKATIASKRKHYLQKFGFFPQFRAGVHHGSVLVTWVGEIKKEIVYVGDVLNTAARIREDCKRLHCDWLVSAEIAEQLSAGNGFHLKFQEEIIPRGKKHKVKLYSVEEINA